MWAQAHSESPVTTGHEKGGYGFAPVVASLEYGHGYGTGEILVMLLRPGNKGAKSTKDHFKVRPQALAVSLYDFYHHDGTLRGERILVSI